MGNLIYKDLINGECLLTNFDPDHYRKVEDLGQGGFGHVDKLARFREKDGLPMEVARKIIQINTPTEDELREYKILQECDHVNILKLFYWKIVEVQDLPKNLYLYTELCSSNLKGFMSANVHDALILKNICGQMIRGCSYLHSMSVVHRDIKPENILIIEKNGFPKSVTVRIADFGFARFIQKEAITSSYQFSTKLTRHYASPEMTQAYNDRSHLAMPLSKFATDIFSLGVVIFEMFTSKLPFTIKELGESTFDVEKTVRDNVADPTLVNSLIKMLQWDPKLRPESKNITSFTKFSWQQPIQSGHKPKAIIVGNCHGKSTLIHTFLNDEYPEEALVSTVGMDYRVLTIEVEGQQVKIIVLDTNGQEGSAHVSARPYRGTEVVIICFSIGDPESLSHVEDYWMPEVTRKRPDTPVILVGNQKDLRNGIRESVTPEEGRAMARKVNASAYLECSALNKEGVKEVFETAARFAVEQQFKESNNRNKNKEKTSKWVHITSGEVK